MTMSSGESSANAKQDMTMSIKRFIKFELSISTVVLRSTKRLA